MQISKKMEPWISKKQVNHQDIHPTRETRYLLLARMENNPGDGVMYRLALRLYNEITKRLVIAEFPDYVPLRMLETRAIPLSWLFAEVSPVSRMRAYHLVEAAISCAFAEACKLTVIGEPVPFPFDRKTHPDPETPIRFCLEIDSFATETEISWGRLRTRFRPAVVSG